MYLSCFGCNLELAQAKELMGNLRFWEILRAVRMLAAGRRLPISLISAPS